MAEYQHGCCAGKHCTKATCMRLPIAGQTCADCRHVSRCTLIFGQNATDDYCQFFPRRFSAATVKTEDTSAP